MANSTKKDLADISLDPIFGWLALMGGLAVIVWGVWFDPSVPSGAFGDRIVNLGRLAQKITLLVCGSAATISGLVWLVAHGIRTDIRRVADKVAEQ